MKILYYDCFSGISGDMNMAAMIDLGVDKQYLIDELSKLSVEGYELRFAADSRKGIFGTRADVILTGTDIQHTQNHLINDSNKTFVAGKLNLTQLKRAKTSEMHDHSHGRNYLNIKQLIEESALNDNVKKLSVEIFRKIAVAEAHIHGKKVDDVHFHEVGAVDSIIDIVAATICFDYLKPNKVIASPVQLGGGFVNCAHGTFPVPAPATLEILKGIPVKLGAVDVETTTPTGAAIIATFATEFTEQPNFSIEKIAYGIGHRDNAVPNVLRVCIATEYDDAEHQLACITECNIDDMNPEMYEYVMNKLFDAGADDVYFQTIIMKKTRPAVKISVMSNLQLVTNIEEILLTETTTLGVRNYQVNKRILKREVNTIETKWGAVSVKVGFLNGIAIKSKPEYSDCLKISQQNNISLADVYNEVLSILNSCV